MNTLFKTKKPFCAYQNDVIKDFAILMSAVVKRVDRIFKRNDNQLLQLCMARTAWSDSMIGLIQ